MTRLLRRSFFATCRTLALAFILPSLLPAVSSAQDWAKAKLEQSTRHREYVKVVYNNRTVNTLVIYPEVKGKAPVVVLIHEIFGLSDWMKLQVDELAAKGYIVVAPDLVSGMAPDGGGTDGLGGQDNVVKAVMGLPADQVTADLDAVVDYALKLPSANGKLAVGGFCWGGGKTFSYATHRHGISAAFVFYGTPPPSAAMASITAPIYGFYGENDGRVTSTVPMATTDMKAAGKSYDPVIYAGAGHGFMRSGQSPDAKPADKQAFEEGFARMLKVLKSTTGS
jgi:carboxymethylenebutenolidase